MGIINTWTEKEAKVKIWLQNMYDLFCDSEFSPEKNIKFIRRRKKDDPSDLYTNNNTLVELGYDFDDVVSEVRDLKLCHYVECMLDTKGDIENDWMVFCKTIQSRQVYIKLKQRQETGDILVIVSFHFARHPYTEFPYK